MVVNLRAGFEERQCKRLSESNTIVPPPTKKPYMEILYMTLVLAIAPTSKPSGAVADVNVVLYGMPSFTREVIHPELGGLPLVRRNSEMTTLSALFLSSHVPKCLVLPIEKR